MFCIVINIINPFFSHVNRRPILSLISRFVTDFSSLLRGAMNTQCYVNSQIEIHVS